MFTLESHMPPSSRQKITAIEAALVNCRRLVAVLESELASEIEAAARAALERRYVPKSRAIVAACEQGHVEQVALMLREPECIEEEPRLPVISELPATTIEAALEEPVAAALTAECVSHDDLTMIRGIDDATATALTSLGVVSYRDIASFKADDVDTINGTLGEPRRVQRQCWIEQAALLAVGVDTAFAGQRREADSAHDAIETDVNAAETELSLESLMARIHAIDAIADAGLNIAVEAAEKVAELSTAVVEEPKPAANVVALVPRSADSKRRLRTVHWMAAAASITLLAAATVATIDMRPAFAQYLHGLSCSTSLTMLAPACGQLTWLQE